jgi:hypothetical protein
MESSSPRDSTRRYGGSDTPRENSDTWPWNESDHRNADYRNVMPGDHDSSSAVQMPG